MVGYTTALQTNLTTAGYLDSPVDGIYGPDTVAAVEALQADNDLPVTGLVDRATAVALEAAVEAAGGEAANLAIAHTAAVQSILAAAGYWTGPIDGQWTDALTAALAVLPDRPGRAGHRRGRRRHPGRGPRGAGRADHAAHDGDHLLGHDRR